MNPTDKREVRRIMGAVSSAISNETDWILTSIALGRVLGLVIEGYGGHIEGPADCKDRPTLIPGANQDRERIPGAP